MQMWGVGFYSFFSTLNNKIRWDSHSWLVHLVSEVLRLISRLFYFVKLKMFFWNLSSTNYFLSTCHILSTPTSLWFRSSYPWLHIRITWGRFKTSWCPHCTLDHHRMSRGGSQAFLLCKFSDATNVHADKCVYIALHSTSCERKNCFTGCNCI